MAKQIFGDSGVSFSFRSRHSQFWEFKKKLRFLQAKHHFSSLIILTGVGPKLFDIVSLNDYKHLYLDYFVCWPIKYKNV